MDDIITMILRNKTMRQEILLILINVFYSVLCGLITQNIISTIAFIILTAIIDILIVTNDYINFDEKITQIFKMQIAKRYILFIFFALLPTLFGFIIHEINTLEDFTVQLFDNLIPNIFGALIVCSMIDHILKFSYEKVIYSLMQSKRKLYKVILRTTFFACYINAVNYDISNKWVGTNFINSLYLFVIIFYGTFAMVSFALRIIDIEPFHHTIKEIYPMWILIWGGTFLLSCGILTFGLRLEKQEVILLLFNTITAGIIAFGILFLLAGRIENRSDSLPIRRLLVFLGFIVFNCIFSFCLWDRKGDIIKQVYSGIAILMLVVFLLLVLVIKQKLENEMSDRRMELLRSCRELLQIQNESPQVLNILEQTVYYNGSECDGRCILDNINNLISEFDNLNKEE